MCWVYELKQAENNNLAMGIAYELGKLALLARTYAREDRRRQKPRATKRLAWAEALDDSLAGASTKEGVWDTIQERDETDDEPNIEAGGRWYVVYRDGDRLYGKDDRTGIVESITKKTFFRYYLTRKVISPAVPRKPQSRKN